jgi:hypothetical protein
VSSLGCVQDSAAYGSALYKLRRVSAVLGVPAEAAVIERLEFVVSGVFCREDENGGRERNADKLRRLPVAPLQKTWVECGASLWIARIACCVVLAVQRPLCAVASGGVVGDGAAEVRAAD